MGITNIGKWSAQASVDAGPWGQGVAQMMKSAEQAHASLPKTFDSLAGGVNKALESIKTGSALNLNSLVSGAIGGLASSLGTGMLSSGAEAMKSFLERGEDVIKQQRRLREEFQLTREQAAGLRQFATERGIDPNELGAQMSAAARHIGELRNQLAQGASGGAGETALRQMGIDAAQFVNLPIPQAITLVTDRMGRLGNASQRAAALNALFGRGWRELVHDFEGGSAALASAEGRAFVPSAQQETLIRERRRMWRELSGSFSASVDQLSTTFSANTGAAMYGLTDAPSLSEARAAERRRRDQQIAASFAENGSFGTDSDRRRRIRERIDYGAGWGGTAEDVGRSLRGRDRELFQQMFPNLRVREEQQALLEDAAAAGTLTDALSRVRAARREQFANQADNDAIAGRIDDRIGALQVEAATIGMSADEAERYRLSLNGATDSQLRNLEIWQQTLQTAREERETREHLQQRHASLRSPLENMRRELGDLIADREQGLSEQDYQRGVYRVLAGAAQGGGEQRLLGSLDAAGSEVSAIMQERESPVVSETAAIRAGLEAMLEQERRQTEAAEAVADAFDSEEYQEFLRFWTSN